MKHIPPLKYFLFRRVTLRRRVWIETLAVKDVAPARNVTLRRRVWIET